MTLNNILSQKAIRYGSHGIILFILFLFFADYFIDYNNELTLVLAVLAVFTIVLLVVRHKQLLLYGLAFLVPVSVPVSVDGAQISLPSELIAVMLSAFFFIKILLGKKLPAGFLAHPITVIVMLDLAWLFISSVFSGMPEVSFKRLLIRLIYYITYYYFYYELFVQNSANIKKIFTLHAFGFLIPIIYAGYKHALLGFTTVGSQQISAPFNFDHTIYGACLAFFIPFLLSSTFSAVDRSQKMIYLALLVIFVLAVILSYSRAAWISLILAGLAGAILKYRIKAKFIFGCMFMLSLIAMINYDKIARSFSDNKEISHSNNVGMHFKSISNVNTDASNKERINRWKCALRMFADKPLLGFGPGTYQFFYGKYQQQLDLTRISTFSGTKGHAHSEYLNYLSETGLPGLLIFISLLITVCYRCVKMYKSQNKLTKRTVLYLLGGLLTYIVHAFFNGFLEFDKMAMPVFCTFAAIALLDRKIKSGCTQVYSSDQEK